jgi:hypothetical protein
VNPQQLRLPDWVRWIAQDSDGSWWGYQTEPLQNHRGWYENEVGHNIRLASGAANTDWQTSLQKIDQPDSLANCRS